MSIFGFKVCNALCGPPSSNPPRAWHPPCSAQSDHPCGLTHTICAATYPAAKLAWFLGWWASKDRKAPCIPGLDMECSNSAKAAWTQAVLDAAEEGGRFKGTVETAHGRTMPFVAQALLLRLLVGRPLFAAAVAEAMQKM